MPQKLKFSIIVPVYNRLDEMKELLESLSHQTFKDFEIIVVEDGSSIKSDKLTASYQNSLDIKYFFKKNEGPAVARNYGLAHAKGNYFIFFDSDCIIPKNYMQIINTELTKNFVDVYGGPDAAMPNFSNFQKAVNYAMTSFFTTGGIRGGKSKIDKFHPRSFNLGFSKKVYKSTGGFPIIRMCGEDIIFAIEVIKRGFKTRLLNDAFVYHKRRISFNKFYKQVFNFGKARYIISYKYPQTFKIFFLFPSLFALSILFLIFLSITISATYILPLIFYIFLVFTDSLIQNRSSKIAVLSSAASIIQLCGYGIGFLHSFLKHRILRKDEFDVLKTPFYKVSPQKK